MRLQGSQFGKINAKRLRRQMTPPEIDLWLALRRNDVGLRFRKQVEPIAMSSTFTAPRRG